MLEIHRDYLLEDKNAKQLQAHVYIMPTGSIKIEIIDKNMTFLADFEQIRFERKGNVTRLIATAEQNGKPKIWQVPLNHQDANELANLIERVAEDLEILMCAL